MKALSNMAISKKDFASYLDIGTPAMSDETWALIIEEIESRVANELDEILKALAEDFASGDFE